MAPMARATGALRSIRSAVDAARDFAITSTKVDESENFREKA